VRGWLTAPGEEKNAIRETNWKRGKRRALGASRSDAGPPVEWTLGPDQHASDGLGLVLCGWKKEWVCQTVKNTIQRALRKNAKRTGRTQIRAGVRDVGLLSQTTSTIMWPREVVELRAKGDG